METFKRLQLDWVFKRKDELFLLIPPPDQFSLELNIVRYWSTPPAATTIVTYAEIHLSFVITVALFVALH